METWMDVLWSWPLHFCPQPRRGALCLLLRPAQVQTRDTRLLALSLPLPWKPAFHLTARGEASVSSERYRDGFPGWRLSGACEAPSSKAKKGVRGLELTGAWGDGEQQGSPWFRGCPHCVRLSIFSLGWGRRARGLTT